MSLMSWRRICWAAALHNYAGVLLFTVGHDRVYTLQGLAPPEPALHYDTWIAFVGVFGVAYAVVARDPASRYAPGIALAGILAKLASVLPQVVSFVREPATTPVVYALPIATDLLWVGVFVWFLSALNGQATMNGPMRTGSGSVR